MSLLEMEEIRLQDGGTMEKVTAAEHGRKKGWKTSQKKPGAVMRVKINGSRDMEVF